MCDDVIVTVLRIVFIYIITIITIGMSITILMLVSWLLIGVKREI